MTSDSGDYNKHFHYAAVVLINKLVKGGIDMITLGQLYLELGAETADERDGVRFAVEQAKKEDVFERTSGINGLYIVTGSGLQPAA